MIQVLTISLWSHLFCGKWSEPEKVFGWLKAWSFNRFPPWVFTPFIGCAMCHAVWVSIPFEVWDVYKHGLHTENILSILCASFLADLIGDFKTWIETKMHQ